MGLFDGLQDMVGGIADNSAIQDIQEQVSGAAEGAQEQAQNIVDDATGQLGL